VGTCTLVANQSGNATYAAAPSVIRSFAISSGTTGGGPGQDADAPVPLWAMVLLGLVLMYSIQRVQRQADQKEFLS
jgi:membrane protein insertase Oxa1/YidC/SpoIIIJ